MKSLTSSNDSSSVAIVNETVSKKELDSPDSFNNEVITPITEKAPTFFTDPFPSKKSQEYSNKLAMQRPSPTSATYSVAACSTNENIPEDVTEKTPVNSIVSNSTPAESINRVNKTCDF